MLIFYALKVSDRLTSHKKTKKAKIAKKIICQTGKKSLMMIIMSITSIVDVLCAETLKLN